jgi:hypothetical protein
MNLPKQSRPVMRDVSRDPIRARVEPQQEDWLGPCLAFCHQRMAPGYPRDFCIANCCGTYGPC